MPFVFDFIGCCIAASLYGIMWEGKPTDLVGDTTLRTVDDKVVAGCCLGAHAVAFWESGDLCMGICSGTARDICIAECLMNCFAPGVGTCLARCYVCFVWEPDPNAFMRTPEMVISAKQRWQGGGDGGKQGKGAPVGTKGKQANGFKGTPPGGAKGNGGGPPPQQLMTHPMMGKGNGCGPPPQQQWLPPMQQPMMGKGLGPGKGAVAPHSVAPAAAMYGQLSHQASWPAAPGFEDHRLRLQYSGGLMPMVAPTSAQHRFDKE